MDQIIGKVGLLKPLQQPQPGAAIESGTPQRALVADQAGSQWQQAVRVNLSSEAKAKLEEEGDIDFGESLNKNKAATAAGEDKDSTERLIEQLKDKIRELTERIALLNSKEDDASQDQAELLRAELAGLYAQLVNLVSEKLTNATAESV